MKAAIAMQKLADELYAEADLYTDRASACSDTAAGRCEAKMWSARGRDAFDHARRLEAVMAAALLECAGIEGSDRLTATKAFTSALAPSAGVTTTNRRATYERLFGTDGARVAEVIYRTQLAKALHQAATP